MSLRLKGCVFALLSFSFLPSAIAETANNQTIIQQKQSNWQERPDFDKYFQQAGVKGTFLLYDLNKNQYLVYNGKIFAADASIAEYCSYVIELFSNYSKYMALSSSSFQEYESCLNWNAAGETTMKHLLSLF